MDTTEPERRSKSQKELEREETSVWYYAAPERYYSNILIATTQLPV